MQKEAHLTAQDLLKFLQVKAGDFGDIAFLSGQSQRVEMSLGLLESPVKNFSFLGNTLWTGLYHGKKVTVGNGGLYAPDSSIVTELLCAGGVKVFIRLGSCGALREDIQVGDFIIVDQVLRGDGASRYYADDSFIPRVDQTTSQELMDIFRKVGTVHQGGIWTTDALFRETKEIVDSYVKKGAVAVDMVTSPLVTIANLYKRKAACVLAVSDNLITGQLGFTDRKFLDSQEKMVKAAFELIH